MTHATKHPMHFLLATMLSAMVLVFNSCANAQDAGLSGTWVLERGTDFDGFVSNPTTDLPQTLQILGDRFVMPRGCAVQLQRESTPVGDVFKNLFKADVTGSQIETFYQKQFKLNIRDVKAVFRKALRTPDCYRDVGYLLQIGDTLVASEGGGQFSFFYKRVAPIQGAAGESAYSQLPFRLASYRALCPKAISWSDRKPIGVTKHCAPLYFPQIAMGSSTDAIARLVSHHNYEGPAVGSRGPQTNDYNNPAKSGLRPIYQALPPKGDIALVHVIDEEGSQSRDSMPGAYLSIRNGKVVSQLNVNCTMGLDYVCRELGSSMYYTLNVKGEFVEHTR
jgi:hypothetical protein